MRIVATHLYDFAVCEHRVSLDFSLDRSMRAPVDEAARLLAERGREIEARTAAELGYARVECRPEDGEGAFRETFDLMTRGVPGIYQAVLLSGRRLAIPDLLRRVEGASDLGAFHYVAGDIKSGLTPRTDQVLQVVFAALLLEKIQGRRPDAGFLLLGDGTETAFRIDDVLESSRLALRSVEEIADKKRETFAFLGDACPRCRWREVCMPTLEKGPDISFVAGMTRTRKRVLARHGFRTAGDLAAIDAPALEALEDRGVETMGLSRLAKQASALLQNRAILTGNRTRVPFPGSRGREHFVLARWDPLGGGEPFLIAFSSRRRPGEAPDRREVRMAGSDEERLDMLEGLLGWVGSDEAPLFHYGGSGPRAFTRIADGARLAPALQGRIEARFFDLARPVRSRAYLPVRRYRFEEVSAAVRGRPLPSVEELEDAPFVWFENHRLGIEGDWEGKLRARALGDLEDLVAVRDACEWETSSP